ncbi:NAD-dependent malic enzyme [Trichococcus ilyis]|uniref:Malate dehydrogenase (Oxaloacetate-decarboxylating) n=1 Tax=Trichococcus ilyis TaxID=640938 RepID=A0A143Y9X9_9LACT|nr:NAD-dependent malic enzyme [Trichococcus ilyis]CZQ83501.1 malic oxidoreductase [Trichococcus ilyis]SEJ33798.1 malate dehydrogenase (oxaloacetate-decarboxylating) [Trichococcus ilyis]
MSKTNGKDLLRQPFLNKGTAFTLEERAELGLDGLLPTAVRTLEEQSEIVYAQLGQLDDAYSKQKHLMGIYDQNRVLFYHVIGKHVTELLPVIYTPTIADTVMNYSRDYQLPQDAVYLDVNRPEAIREALLNGSKDMAEIKMMVITDGEGVLGIGDWGIQGVAISIGKLAVYTVASGLNPQQVLPIVIDAGTNNEQLLEDPFYLGNKHKRVTGEAYYPFIETFVEEASALFPDVLFHWEDFGRDNAANILEQYRDKICTFNDDIQGTGVMMSAAMDSVVRITDKPITEHKVLVFGGGTAGVGVSDQILLEMTLQGADSEEARKQFYMVDRYGLVTDDMADLTPGQQKYARSAAEFSAPLADLADIIDAVKPTVLIGTSGQAGAFTEEVVRKMAAYNERPAIMPISNPTRLCEAKASDVIAWSEGRALVVTGSPSDPIAYNGVDYKIGQANNALLYPGLGFGIVIAKAKTVTDRMLSAAAHGITSLQNLDEAGAAILPPVSQLREASKLVAAAVIQAAIEDGVNGVEINDPMAAVEDAIWKAEY